MADAINLVGRLTAFERGRAVRIASHLQIAIQPHALVVTPLALAGEDTSLHAIAVGGVGAEPSIFIVPDPRVRDDQYKLVVLKFGAVLEAYYQRCRAGGDFPQIWTASSAGAGHLDVVADRLRFVRDDAAVKRVGELLTYATERAPIAGQQALMTMTGALSQHYATGQQEGEDEHLGTFLVWLNPPSDGELRKAIAAAECEVMGVKTDPEFDRNTLQPLINAYHGARKGGASPAKVAMRVKAIEDALAPIVRRIHAATQQGFAHLVGRFPTSGLVADLRAHEARVFESFMKGRDEQVALPYRDKPKAAAFKMAEREHAAESTKNGAIYGDAMALERARLAGDILTGRVRDVTSARVDKKTVHRFVVETPQQNLHMRARDELTWLTDTRLKCVIEGVDKFDAGTRVRLRVSRGMRCVGPPQDGAVLEFGPAPPDWMTLVREREKMSCRLQTSPWTHVREASAPDPTPHPQPPPADLLAAIEALK